MLLADSRDVHHCPILFPRSTDFSSPLRNLASFVVRVYVSIVAGGSVTNLIIAQTLCPVPLSASFKLAELGKLRLPLLSLPASEAGGFSEKF